MDVWNEQDKPAAPPVEDDRKEAIKAALAFAMLAAMSHREDMTKYMDVMVQMVPMFLSAQGWVIVKKEL